MARTVLVTDGDERPALAITRSLGQRGFRVVVGAETPVSLASTSRYCAMAITYPSPTRCPDAFERFLREYVADHQVDVVLPVTDVANRIVAASRHELEAYTIVAAPPFEAFDQIADKAALVRRAAACGIAIPRTQFVDGLASLSAVIEHVRYPAVIKPARSRVRTGSGWTATTVAYANDEDELWRVYRTTDYLAAYPSLIQERIVGPGTGLFVLCDRGRVIASFAHRRLREKPPSGGASVLCESIPADPALVEQAARLLGPVEWHGVAMLEYKQDRRSGTPFLMEVNGRFWGSLQLAVDAGMDFPYLACQLALRQPVDAPPTYAVGFRSRWALGDLDHLFMRLRPGDGHLPEGMSSRLRTVLDFLNPFLANLKYDVFRTDDVRPAFYELRQYARALRVFDHVRRPFAAAVHGRRARRSQVPQYDHAE
jgi:predicted ATP-grasp superfamily ATP-dependent carboligase